MQRSEVLRRILRAMPPDLMEVLDAVLEDDVVTDDERVMFLHALVAQPMHPIHKGILREAIELWAQQDAGLIARTRPT